MKNITGLKFNYLTALRKVDCDKYYNQYWLFKCDCGIETRILKGAVVSGHTKSCGCYSLSLLIRQKRSSSIRTHGMTKTRFYRIWKNMLGRIRNKTDFNYESYGGRGIKVCKRWYKFENFFNDMIKGYKDNLTIDRVNNNKGYNLKNCKWSTMKEQNRNRRNCLKYKNELAKDASFRLGGSPCLISRRIENGWSIKNAFTIPVKK